MNVSLPRASGELGELEALDWERLGSQTETPRLRQRILWAALMFAAALLTREIALLFLLPVLVAELYARRLRRALMLGLSVAPYLLYQVILMRAFGDPGVVKGDFGAPFVGIWSLVHSVWHVPLRDALIHQGSLLVVAAVVIGALAVALPRLRQSYDIAVGGMMFQSAAALFATYDRIWGHYNSVARVFGGIYILTVFAFARHRTMALRLLVGIIVALSLFTFMRPVAISPVDSYFVKP